MWARFIQKLAHMNTNSKRGLISVRNGVQTLEYVRLSDSAAFDVHRV
jgi:hypothetical protein